MKFCLDIAPGLFLQKPDEMLYDYKRSGIDSVQLYVRGSGPKSEWTDLKETEKAAKLIREAGMECALVSVPVGHPTDGRTPSDEEIQKALNPGWRIRTGRDGKPEYMSAELTDKMIRDVLAYAKQFADLGFDTYFMDDDLRSANLSDSVGGCFCPECLAAFSKIMGRSYSRDALLEDPEALKAWTVFQSERVTRLMRELGKIVAKPGIMIMFNGDERHGIATTDISRIPGIQVRVGEEHFFDEFARSLPGRLENFLGVTGHLYRLGGRAETYSETTVVNASHYRYTQTTPEHTVSKAYLALTAGVDNIDWMCEKYFDAMAANYKDLRTYWQESCGVRAYPVHVARDSQVAGKGLYADTTATGLGLPAAPVFAEEAAGGEILVLPEHLAALPEWKMAAMKYDKVVRPDELKAAVAGSDIPHAQSESPLCLSYIPQRKRVAVYNPLETEQKAVVCDKEITLPAGGASVILL